MAEKRDSQGAVTQLRANAPPSLNAAPEFSMPSTISRAAEWLSGPDGAWPPDVKRQAMNAREVSYWISSLETALVPAAAREIVTALEALSLQYWSKEFSREDAKILARQWVEDFGHLPLDVVAEACRQWRRTQSWFPKINEFLGIAEPLLARRRAALKAARTVLDALEGRQGEGSSGPQYQSLQGLIDRLRAGEEAARAEPEDVPNDDYVGERA